MGLFLGGATAQLENLHKRGIKVNVNWYYDDEAAKEEFQYEFAQGLTVPIVFLLH